MEARCLPAFAEPVLFRELLEASGNWIDKSVSVTGRLDQHDAYQCQAQLVDPRAHLSICVDTRLVEPFNPKLGSLFQFIGEIRELNTDCHMILQARVVRCTEGLDLVKYEQALQTQRQYLLSRNTTDNAIMT